GLWLLTRALAGRAWMPSLLALALFAVSPSSLRNSRLVLAEVPSVGLAMLAVGLAAQYHASRRSPWLVAAGVALGLSLAVKPLTAATAVPIALLAFSAWWPPRWIRGGLALAVVGAVAALVALLCAAPFGLDRVYGQSVQFHVQVQAAQSLDVTKNLGTAMDTLMDE